MPDSRGRESAYVRAGLGPRERFRAMNREPSVMARPLLKRGRRGDRRMRRASDVTPMFGFPADGFQTDFDGWQWMRIRRRREPPYALNF